MDSNLIHQQNILFFVVRETLEHYKRGGSYCWAASLDATKAFDRLLRDGLFVKLMNKIPDVVWRALYLYYSISKAAVRSSKGISHIFRIEEGVKQGGVISPILFNFFLNDLLNECIEADLGARVYDVNVSIVAYCDDLILLSPLESDLMELLLICERYAFRWKIRFNPSKSTIFCTDGNKLRQSTFRIGGGILERVDGFVYLGLPIGGAKFVADFFMKKFGAVERAFFSIRRIGLHSGLIHPECLGFIYRQFCQSIYTYGLEVITLSKSLLKNINTRQGILLKLSLGLPKFSRNTLLFRALGVLSINELYTKSKIQFLKQIKKNGLAHALYMNVSSSRG